LESAKPNRGKFGVGLKKCDDSKKKRKRKKEGRG